MTKRIDDLARKVAQMFPAFLDEGSRGTGRVLIGFSVARGYMVGGEAFDVDDVKARVADFMDGMVAWLYGNPKYVPELNITATIKVWRYGSGVEVIFSDGKKELAHLYINEGSVRRDILMTGKFSDYVIS